MIEQEAAPNIGDAELSELADAFVSYTTTMSGATREVRMQLLHSPLEELWAEVLGIFARADPRAPDLLLLILDRMPNDPMLPDSEQMLIEDWLRSASPSDREWLVENAKTNPKLRGPAEAAIGYLGPDQI